MYISEENFSLGEVIMFVFVSCHMSYCSVIQVHYVLCQNSFGVTTSYISPFVVKLRQ